MRISWDVDQKVSWLSWEAGDYGRRRECRRQEIDPGIRKQKMRMGIEIGPRSQAAPLRYFWLPSPLASGQIPVH